MRSLIRGLESLLFRFPATPFTAVVELYLDIAVTLGIPQLEEVYDDESSASELVDKILLVCPESCICPNCSDSIPNYASILLLQRLPTKSTEQVVLDSALRLTNASNAASLASAELAAVANVFEMGDYVRLLFRFIVILFLLGWIG